jgi:hypothetical protein
MINRVKDMMLYAYLVCGIITSLLIGIYCGLHYGFFALIYGVGTSVFLFAAIAPVFIKIVNWVISLKNTKK